MTLTNLHDKLSHQIKLHFIESELSFISKELQDNTLYFELLAKCFEISLNYKDKRFIDVLKEKSKPEIQVEYEYIGFL